MRKTEMVTIPLDGRDKGKTFLVTEMSAAAGDAWATRAFLMLGRSGMEVPDEIRGAGMAGIAIYGIRALARVHYEDAKPLLDEMIRCVRYVYDPRNPNAARELMFSSNGESDDIEEVSTYLYLRSKVFELHTGFSLADALFPADSAEDEAGNPSPTLTSQVR